MISIYRGWSARVAARVVAVGTMGWLAGCSGDADSHETPERTLETLQSPYLETTRFGNLSAAFDDASSDVLCSPEETLTGCDCYSPWGACDGAYSNSQLCQAFNKSNGKGVYAVAQCVTFTGANQVQTTSIESALSESSADSFTTVDCDAGWTLTGCSCYSPWGGCEGASIVGSNTCRADNKPGGRGVYAEARCLRLGETRLVPVRGPVSGTTDDAGTSVSCPDDYALTGCTCSSANSNASCDGAYVSGLDCVALNKAGGSGVEPQAMCVQVAGCHGACGGPSSDGCACDAGCEARGDCCQNYGLLCESRGGSTSSGGSGPSDGFGASGGGGG